MMTLHHPAGLPVRTEPEAPTVVAGALHQHWAVRFKAAGLLLHRTGPDGVPQVLLAVLGLPVPRGHRSLRLTVLGGRVGAGERPHATALGEFFEETGERREFC